MDTPVKLKLDRNARFLPSNKTPTEIIKTICAFILYYTLIYNLLEPLQTWIRNDFKKKRNCKISDIVQKGGEGSGKW